MTIRAVARLILRPFRAFVAVLFVSVSLSYMFGVPQPRSVDALLPVPVRVLWGVCLMLGGSGLLIGLSSGTRSIEKMGLVQLAGGSVVYSMVVLHYSGKAALLPAGLCIAVAGACLVDGWDRLQNWAQRKLYRDLRRSA